MISTSDTAYRETKMVKKGLRKLSSPFIELADWILNRYQVRPLNISYDILEHNKRPRLQVIFEFAADAKAFKAENGLFPDPTRQSEVREAFALIIRHKSEYAAGNLLVLFTAFEPIAREEANAGVTNERLAQLKSELNCPELWEIKRNLSTAIFFFYTNGEVVRCEQTGGKERLNKAYFKLIKECDEFGYLNESTFSIKLDSKENFDKNYQSNWFYYSRNN
jgi:hypothetical protein